VEICRRYSLLIKIINSTVLNKLQSYSRISALGPEGHCTNRFKESDVYFMSTGCGRPQGERGSGSCGRMWTEVVKNPIFLKTS